MPNNVVSYNRAISNRDGVAPGREKFRCEPIQRPHQIFKIRKLRISSWNVGAMPGRASEDGFALPNYAKTNLYLIDV